MPDYAELAERAWRVLEPVHGVTYFAPESRAEGDRLGLKGHWMSYFAFRSAPMGAVPAAVVEA
ncbi:MAG: helix-turn-helix domain-containing protein, partial [Acidimicrobiales bacterium]